MKKTRAGFFNNNNVFNFIPISFFILILSTQIQAQSTPITPQSPPNNNLYPYARFSPSLLIIIATLITSLFFMVLFSIYIRHCTDATNTVLPGLSRRVAAAMGRGLDRSIIETFPTFTYSEVKDHKIGKGALECAVCLNEFEEDETLRLIPKCDHVFHPECIDSWLEAHVTCPVCRADLTPNSDDLTGPVNESTDNEVSNENSGADRVDLRNEETVIQIDHEENQNQNQNQQQQPQKRGVVNRNLSFKPVRAPRSISMRRAKLLSFGKFRSYSTGNLLVQPGQDLERFTLRLPADVRKEVVNRALLNRTKSFANVEGSSRNRTGDYGRIERSDREVKSDRWEFFRRAMSMNLRSPRPVPDTGDAGGSSSKRSGGSRTPVKMLSFKCLEPKAADETSLVTGEPVRPVV